MLLDRHSIGENSPHNDRVRSVHRDSPSNEETLQLHSHRFISYMWESKRTRHGKQ